MDLDYTTKAYGRLSDAYTVTTEDIKYGIIMEEDLMQRQLKRNSRIKNTKNIVKITLRGSLI
jgi:hypothetical protein